MDPVRFSRLKLMAKSPAHYLAATTEETAAMERGTAVHSLVLGGPLVVAYHGVRRGKEWEAFAAAEENAGAVILTASEYDKARAMADAVMDNRQAMEVLRGEHEVELDWSFLGRACRSRVDCIGPHGLHIAELKTAVSSDPDRFSWQSQRLHYHAQLAFYREAVRSAGLANAEEAYVVAVESSAPYVVTTMRLTERALLQGERTFRLWFERLLACEAAGAFPGYCESIADLDVPEEDAELVFGEDAA